ncbi:hypothetical protein H6G89_05535 [Oscillatoria sp. FACHB-1407]|uniref:hypothetical protein n=1 Tax=Oscillatoria sp. FACHB-1407 TaxID=2692847 RepID=UPI0016859693|nr:hypothetical protein [Oscillatoria sp. FACHB-1407]MBD2460502.1 hypothetical protein [Oscillatoria sp. FACHB-1407]
MKPQDNREEELRRREQELRERELQLRLRELEAEIHQLPPQPSYPSAQQPPLLHPTKHEPPPTKFQTWLKKLTTVGKFLAIVVAVIVAVRVASWLATVVIVAGIAWLAYKILFETDKK